MSKNKPILSLENLTLLNRTLRETTVTFELKNVFTGARRLGAKANLAMVLRVMNRMPHTPLAEIFAIDDYNPEQDQLIIRPLLSEFSSDYRIQLNAEKNAQLFHKKYSAASKKCPPVLRLPSSNL